MSEKKFIIISIAIGIFAFLGFAISRLPAHIITAQLEKHLPISIGETRGTIWQGSASRIILNDIPLNKFEWKLSAWRLLKGSAHLQLKLDGDGFNMQTTTDINSAGKILVKDAIINAETAAIIKIADLPDMAGGQWQAKIEHLSIADIQQIQTQLPALQANIQWLGATVMYEGTHQLGDYTISLQSQPNSGSVERIRIDYSDQNAALGASGNSELLANGQYSTVLTLTPRENLSPIIKNFLPFLAQPDPSGLITVKRTGQITEVYQLLGLH